MKIPSLVVLGVIFIIIGICSFWDNYNLYEIGCIQRAFLGITIGSVLVYFGITEETK